MGKTSKNTCGRRIKMLRAGHDLKQIELSAALEVEAGVDLNQHAISGIENGTRFVKDIELIALAKVLKTTPYWLMFGDEIPKEFNKKK